MRARRRGPATTARRGGALAATAADVPASACGRGARLGRGRRDGPWGGCGCGRPCWGPRRPRCGRRRWLWCPRRGPLRLRIANAVASACRLGEALVRALGLLELRAQGPRGAPVVRAEVKRPDRGRGASIRGRDLVLRGGLGRLRRRGAGSREPGPAV